MKTNEERLEELLAHLDSLDHIHVEDIPKIDLYMDQVTTFMEDRLGALKRYPEDKVLTKTMINNYAKNNLLPSPVRKKYTQEHILLLIFIYYFKNLLNFNDIETINYYNDHKEDCDILDRINVGSRDNARRPLCWNNTKNYGFSTADKTWIKLHSQGKEINLENDRKSDKSVFAYYQKLLVLRNTGDVVKYGKFADLTIDDGYFAYTRTLDNEIILVVCNFDKEKNILNLPVGKYIFGNGSAARATNGKYAPFEAAVFNVSKME